MKGNFNRFLALFLALAMILVSGVVLTNEGFKATNDGYTHEGDNHPPECYEITGYDVLLEEGAQCDLGDHDHGDECYETVSSEDIVICDNPEHGTGPFGHDDCNWKLQSKTETNLICHTHVHCPIYPGRENNYGEWVPCCYPVVPQKKLNCQYVPEEETFEVTVTLINMSYMDGDEWQTQDGGSFKVNSKGEMVGSYSSAKIDGYFATDAYVNSPGFILNTKKINPIMRKTNAVGFGNRELETADGYEMESISFAPKVANGVAPTEVNGPLEVCILYEGESAFEPVLTATLEHVYQIFGEDDEDIVRGVLPNKYYKELDTSAVIDKNTGKFDKPLKSAIFTERVNVDGYMLPVVEIDGKAYYLAEISSGTIDSDKRNGLDYIEQTNDSVIVSGLISEGNQFESAKIQYDYYLLPIPDAAKYIVRYVEKGNHDNVLKDPEERPLPENGVPTVEDIMGAGSELTEWENYKLEKDGIWYAFAGGYGKEVENKPIYEDGVLTLEYEKIPEPVVYKYTVKFIDKATNEEITPIDDRIIEGQAYKKGYLVDSSVVTGWRANIVLDSETAYKYVSGFDSDTYAIDKENDVITLYFEKVSKPVSTVTFYFGIIDKGQFKSFTNLDPEKRIISKGGVLVNEEKGDNGSDSVTTPVLNDYKLVGILDDGIVKALEPNEYGFVQFIDLKDDRFEPESGVDYIIRIVYQSTNPVDDGQKGDNTITPGPGPGTNFTPDPQPVEIPDTEPVPEGTPDITPVVEGTPDEAPAPTPGPVAQVVPVPVPAIPTTPTAEPIPTPGVEINIGPDGNINLTPVDDVEAALADLDLGHICNILYFIMLLCTTVALGFYYRSAKAHNERIFEIRKELGEDDPYKKN